MTYVILIKENDNPMAKMSIVVGDIIESARGVAINFVHGNLDVELGSNATPMTKRHSNSIISDIRQITESDTYTQLDGDELMSYLQYEVILPNSKYNIIYSCLDELQPNQAADTLNYIAFQESLMNALYGAYYSGYHVVSIPVDFYLCESYNSSLILNIILTATMIYLSAFDEIILFTRSGDVLLNLGGKVVI